MLIRNITATLPVEFKPIDIQITITSEEELNMLMTFIGYTGHLTEEVKRYSKSFDKAMCQAFLNGLYNALDKSQED